jgi:NADH-quinone oxidoreductase subunit E
MTVEATMQSKPTPRPGAAIPLPPKRVVRPGEPFTAGDRQALDAILDRNGREPSALLAILQDIQDVAKYLPRSWLAQVAGALGLPETRIYRMATFFRALSLEPRGEHVCTVCMGTACHVRGAPRLVEKLERDLALRAGETTKDMKFTLETVNCVGACALGPLVILDGTYHGNMNSTRLDRVLKPVREGK